MDFDMLFLANSQGSSTKSLLLRSLAALRSASIIQLHHFIRKEFARSVSYQAVRQALLEMIDEGIIEKTGANYSIRPLWVDQLRETVATLERTQDTSRLRIIDKDTTQLSLKNLDELGHFVLISLEKEYFDLSKGKDIHLYLNHLWIPFSNVHKRERLKRVFEKNKVHATVRGKTLGDRMLRRWYEHFGPVELGVSKSFPCEYIVHADCLVQIYMPQELTKLMDDLYSLRFQRDFLQKVSDMTFKEYGIEIVITRNAAIAERIRREIIGERG